MTGFITVFHTIIEEESALTVACNALEYWQCLT